MSLTASVRLLEPAVRGLPLLRKALHTRRIVIATAVAAAAAAVRWRVMSH